MKTLALTAICDEQRLWMLLGTDFLLLHSSVCV